MCLLVRELLTRAIAHWVRTRYWEINQNTVARWCNGWYWKEKWPGSLSDLAKEAGSLRNGWLWVQFLSAEMLPPKVCGFWSTAQVCLSAFCCSCWHCTYTETPAQKKQWDMFFALALPKIQFIRKNQRWKAYSYVPTWKCALHQTFSRHGVQSHI